MKRLTVLTVSVLLLLFGSVLFAGELRIGGEVGGNYTIYNYFSQERLPFESGTISTVSKYRMTENGTFYFDVLVPVEYRFNERFSLATGLHWRADATRYKRSGFSYSSSSGGFTEETLNDYSRVRHFLEVPLTARIYLETGPVKIFLGAGGYLGFYLGTWQYGNMENGFYKNEKVPTFAAAGPESGDNIFTAGLTAELGAGFELGPGELYLAARYSYGLTNLTKNRVDATDIYFSSATLGAGYTVAIGGAK